MEEYTVGTFYNLEDNLRSYICKNFKSRIFFNELVLYKLNYVHKFCVLISRTEKVHCPLTSFRKADKRLDARAQKLRYRQIIIGKNDSHLENY